MTTTWTKMQDNFSKILDKFKFIWYYRFSCVYVDTIWGEFVMKNKKQLLP